MLNKSLEDPTENSLAQATWMSIRDVDIAIHDSLASFTSAHEARAHEYFFRGNWAQAVGECERWQRDQPFSPGPGIDGSFILITALNDFDRAKELIKASLMANPSNPFLHNNMAVTLINLNDLTAAKEHIRLTDPCETDSNYRNFLSVGKLATEGLWNYRDGDEEKGHQLYSDALSLAQHQTQVIPDLATRVKAFHLLEEFRHGSHVASHKVEGVLRELKKYNVSPICKILTKKLTTAQKNFGPPSI